MTLKVTRKMPPFEGVAANSTATLRLPIGLTYHKLLITIGNVAAGPGPELVDITAIRLLLNGELIQRFAGGGGVAGGGDDIDLQNTYNGLAAIPATPNTGVITLDFDRIGLRTRAAEELTAIGTGFPGEQNAVTTMTLEMDIAAGATNPTMSAVAIQSAPVPLGVIKKVNTFFFDPAGATTDFQMLNLPTGDIFDQIFFKNSAGLINGLRVERDNFIVFDRTDLLNDVEQANGVRVPQASLFVYDPTEAGNGAEGLVTAGVNDLRFIADVSAAMQLVASVQSIGGLG